MWLLLWRVATRGLGFISTLVLARLLVPADFGLVAMASAFIAAVDSLSQLGVQQALIRHPEDSSKLYDAAFTIQLGRAVITAILIVACAPWAAEWFHEPRLVAVLMVLAGTVVMGGFENIGIIEFRREIRFDIQFRLLLIPRVVQVLTTIPAALILHSYWALMVGVVCSKAAWIIMNYIAHPYRPKLRLTGWRHLAGFSFWIWATSLASLVWERCDPFVLGPHLGPARLGVYFLAAEIATLPLSELISPIADALFAGFSAAQKGGGSSLRHAPAVAVTMLLALAPFVLAISCGSGDIVAVLVGPKWVEAQPLIAILTWLCLFSPFSTVCRLVMIANAKVRANFIGNCVASAVKLATMLVAVSLTTRLDYIAGATAICVTTESAIYIVLLKNVGHVRLLDNAGAVVRTLLALAVTAVVLLLSGMGWSIVETPVWLALLHGMAIGVVTLAVYVGMIMLLWRLWGRPDGPETHILGLLREQRAAFGSRRLKASASLP